MQALRRGAERSETASRTAGATYGSVNKPPCVSLLWHIARFGADRPLEFRLQPVFWPPGEHAVVPEADPPRAESMDSNGEPPMCQSRGKGMSTTRRRQGRRREAESGARTRLRRPYGRRRPIPRYAPLASPALQRYRPSRDRKPTPLLSVPVNNSRIWPSALCALSIVSSQGQAEEASPVLTTVAGTSLSFHVSKPEELEGAVRDVAAHADILWVGVETWTHDCLSAAREIERIRTVTDLAHRHDMGVAFGLHWQSLLPKENAIADCPFAGVVLKPEDGVFQKVRNWDFGSDEALAQFEARLRRHLDRCISSSMQH